MNIDYSVLKNDEKAIFGLRSIYRRYGYSQYKMSKFEEYDLYVRNKDFLVSDNIITFTDTNGKLLALKPDVTLSIIKNGKDIPGVIEKVYYNENVYRVSKGSHQFKEIMQVGLECIGDIDSYCVYEVLTLAAESLASISDSCVIDISHLGILSDILASLGVSHEAEKKIVKCIGEKSLHDISAICKSEGANEDSVKKLLEVVGTYGSISECLPKLSAILGENENMKELSDIATALSKTQFADKFRIDFSVIGDMSYYNGIVFKGFVDGIPNGILSGGRYDRLMSKMGRKSGAIGFAVYLDMLERLSDDMSEYDVDALVLYDDTTDMNALCDALKLFSANGQSVLAQKAIPENIKYRQLLKIKERGVEILENNA
ncbi:MAG: ATP phosphoribosyltransferase regulatory subunit [Clostridia bacterium]|nr:ATP phosphoribosyltransferase regulatory subunit [Clostridia bacterium]